MSKKDSKTIFERTNEAVEGFLQSSFYSFGYFVGERPRAAIAASLVFAVLCMLGFRNFTEENRPDKLWIPQDTQAMSDRIKYEEYFPRFLRVEELVITSSTEGANVLAYENLKEILEMWEDIESVNVTVDKEMWWLKTKLCQEQDGQGSPCFIKSVLGAWNYNLQTFQADGVNYYMNTLNTFLNTTGLQSYLGNMKTNMTGHVVSADALRVTVLLKSNDVPGDRNYEDPQSEKWEETFLDITRSDGLTQIKVYPFAERSWRDEFGAAIGSDLSLVFVSYVIMMIYLSSLLGTLPCVNCLDSRVSIAMAALLSVALAVVCSIGLCSGFGFFYSTLHAALPFVLLGLGVDDSFVLMESFRRTSLNDGIKIRSASGMSHAGVSILITSLTDFVAFMISSTSAFPALESFCIYAAFGILLLFWFQISVFAPSIVMDELWRRLKGRRDVLCCCTSPRSLSTTSPATPKTKKTDVESNNTSPKTTHQTIDPNCMIEFMDKKYAPTMANASVSVHMVLLLVIGALTSASIYGTTELNVESNFRKFVPESSYVQQYFKKYDKYFYDNPVQFYVVLEDMNYSNPNIQQAILDIGSELDACCSEYVVDSMTSPFYQNWFQKFHTWLPSSSASTDLDSNGFLTNQTQFNEFTRAFLATSAGQYYSQDVKFDSNGNIVQSRVTHALISALSSSGYEDHGKEVSSMNALRKKCVEWSISAFPFSYEFMEWEMLDIIKKELIRNVLLCLVAVLIITMILIAHPMTAFLVFLCVMLTLIDVLGFMHFWGLAIDNVTVINANLAVGLSVDYAAHIGHHFMVSTGTRRERVRKSLSEMGAPVFNGAFSTFLAVSLLGVSQSYVFIAMFKQFFLTVIFGVMHGLIFLPIALLYLGPQSNYDNDGSSSSSAIEMPSD